MSILLYLNASTSTNVLIYPLEYLLSVLVASEFQLFLLLYPCFTWFDKEFDWYLVLFLIYLSEVLAQLKYFTIVLLLILFFFFRNHPYYNNLGVFKVVSDAFSVSLQRRTIFCVPVSPAAGLQKAWFS